MISFFVFFQWFELCFQALFCLRKGSTFTALFHSRDPFWSHFCLMFGLFFSYFRSFSVLGRTLGALEANFFITKTAWTTKRRPSEIFPKINSLFWSHFGVRVCDFFVFLSFIFKHRFLLSSEIAFSWILASFRNHFLILFCTDFLQLWHSKTCFLQVQGCQI